MSTSVGRRLAILLLCLASCATVPVVRPVADSWALFPEDTDIYVYAKTDSHTELLRSVLGGLTSSPGDIDSILANTRKLFGGVRLTEGDPDVWIAAEGDFAPTLMSVRMNMDAEWSKSIEPELYWTHKRNHLKVSFPDNTLILLTNTDMLQLLERRKDPRPASIPDEVAYAVRVSDAVTFVPHVPPGLFQTLGFDFDPPVRTVWLAVENTGEAYVFSAWFLLPGEREAQAFVLAVRLALVSWMRALGIPDLPARLKEIQIVAQGAVVKLCGLKLRYEVISSSLAAVLPEWSE